MDKIECQDIEHRILKLYLEIQKQIPKLHSLTFDVSTYKNGRTTLHGYFHIGERCECWYSIDQLIFLVSRAEARALRKEILFRKFN